MESQAFFDNFEIVANAPGGIARLRELILDLAIRGALVGQDDLDRPLDIAWDFDLLKLDSQKIWGDEFLESTPKSWARLPLALIGKWGSGGTPKRGNRTYYGGEIPWLVIGDLNDGLVLNAENFITKKGLAESSATLVPMGAVFVAMYGSIGKSGIAGIECATNQAIAHCVPDQNLVSTEFLFRLILGLRKRLFGQGRGLAQQNISQTVLKHLMVSLPPLTEQRRIVAKVDQLMALCDELEGAQIKCNSIRTAARKSAIDSISTATTPEELDVAWKRISNNWTTIADTPESISSLRSLILDIFLSNFLGNGQGAKNVNLGDVVRILNGDRSSNYPSKEHRVNSGIPFINAGHLVNGRIDLSEMDYITPQKFDSLSGGKLILNDVLFCLRGSLGKCALNTEILQGTVASSLTILRPNGYLDANYLLRFLQSGLCSNQIKKNDNGTAQPNLSAKNLAKFEFRLPDLEDQKRIVAKVDQLLSLCDELEHSLLERSELIKKIAGAMTAEVAA